MEKQTLTEEQRKLFTRLLAQAQNRVETELEDNHDLKDRITSEVVPELAKKSGASKLIVKVRNLRKQTEDTEKALYDLGFDCGEDDISLRYDAPEALSKALEAAQKAAKKERDKVLRKYDIAMLNLVAAASVEDAKKLVENLF